MTQPDDNSEEKIVLVTGSRGWTDVNLIHQELEAIESQYRNEDPNSNVQFTLVHGGAQGADLLASQVAKNLKWKVIAMPVTTSEWKTLGKRAGILRNTEMIRKYRPHHAVAFQLDGSPGTAHCISELNVYRTHINTRLKEPVKVIRTTTHLQTLATSTCYRRMRKDLAEYKKERITSPWLPDINYIDPEAQDVLEGTFEIPDHQPFKFIVHVTKDFPFKPLKLECIPMPNELYECALGNTLHMWTYDHSPAHKLLHLVITIWSLVTLEDLPKSATWKGKGKLKRPNEETPSPSETNKRKKLPELEQIIEQALKKDEEKFEEDLAAAIRNSTQ